MTVNFNNREIGFFTINNRSSVPEEYWPAFQNLVTLSDEFDFDGMLCFSANETLIDPWLAADYLIQNSKRMMPIVALNPVYMHPFTATKMVNSFAYMYGRKTVLNLITGASGRDREVLFDDIEHGARYDRLGEYAQIIQRLIKDVGKTDFNGLYYKLQDAVLSPEISKDLHPLFLVAGHSEGAMKTAEQVDAVKLRMLGPQLEHDLPDVESGLGVHLGIISRETTEAAWQVAEKRFQHDPEMDGLLDYVMEGSDSVWKQKLYKQTMERENKAAEFWLEPFRQMKADCPYLVGSHDRIAQIIADHIESGVDWFVFDLPDNRAEFLNTAICLAESLKILGIQKAQAIA